MSSPTQAKPPIDTPAEDGSASTAHLHGHLDIALHRIQRLVDRRRQGDPEPDDAFRGLYLSDAHVDALMDREGPAEPPAMDSLEQEMALVEEAADRAEDSGQTVRLRQMMRHFALSVSQVHLLIMAALPDLDPRVGQLYGYLNDDVSRKRLTVGLALDLLGRSPLELAARALLDPTSVSVTSGLLEITDTDLPLLGRSVRVPDHVTDHLLGSDRLPPEVAALTIHAADIQVDGTSALARAMTAEAPLAYLQEGPASAGPTAATIAMAAAGRPVLLVDVAKQWAPVDRQLATLLVQTARLRGQGLYLHGFDALAADAPAVARLLADAPLPVIASGRAPWDPLWANSGPLILASPTPVAAARSALWHQSLGTSGTDTDPVHAMAGFLLNPEQIVRAATTATIIAHAEDRSATQTDVQAGARAQNAVGLERLARRLQPIATWDDIVLSPSILGQLREIAARARHRDTVLGEYAMGRKASAGNGVGALFAGPSGTGKTLGAEVIAGSLGLDLYVIDLSTVVDKYIGETEKNLERVFEQAEQVNGVLLFDEADALFGKRSEVSDAHDRYANVEVAYLLQRMETFDGLAILTTNLRANIDPAFTRRLDAVIDFVKPDEDHRLVLWRLNLPKALPQDGDDIDLSFMAASFPLTGGEIRNACVTAAYLATDAGRAVRMADLIRGTAREYRKLGRMCVASEFGPYFDLLEGM